MPNHVRNRLKAPWRALEPLINSEGNVDFSLVAPVPDVITRGDIPSNVETLAQTALGLIDFKALGQASASDIAGITDNLHAGNALRQLTGDFPRGTAKEFSDEEFELFVGMMRAYRECGSLNWYDWNIEHWGTKWNAYETNVGKGFVSFETAWSHPQPVLVALSKKYPEERIEHQWADEDTGANCGRQVLFAGEPVEHFRPEAGSTEAFEASFALWPERRDDYQKTATGFEYVEK